MAIPWLRPQDRRSLQGVDEQAPREQFPANDSYYGERRELAAYGGSPQNDAMRADPISAPNSFSAAPSQFAQDVMQKFGADKSKGASWGAPAATAQPMQQASYAAAQPVAQNRVNPMIENSRTAVMNNPALPPAQQQSYGAAPAQQAQQQFAARSQFAQDQGSRVDGQQKATWGAAPAPPAHQQSNRPAQRWDQPNGGIVGTNQPQRGWGNRPAERQPAWGRSQQQPASQGNTASPAQPAQRDAAAYGQPKKWGA